jgi:hypothetical protein
VRVVAELVGIVAGALTIAAFVARWWVNRKRAQRGLEQRDQRQLPPGNGGGS